MGMGILALGGGRGEGGWEVGMTISLTARISHVSVYSRNSLQRNPDMDHAQGEILSQESLK